MGLSGCRTRGLKLGLRRWLEVVMMVMVVPVGIGPVVVSMIGRGIGFVVVDLGHLDYFGLELDHFDRHFDCHFELLDRFDHFVDCCREKIH